MELEKAVPCHCERLLGDPVKGGLVRSAGHALKPNALELVCPDCKSEWCSPKDIKAN